MLKGPGGVHISSESDLRGADTAEWRHCSLQAPSSVPASPERLACIESSENSTYLWLAACLCRTAANSGLQDVGHMESEKDAKLSLRLRNRQACSQGTNACVQLLLSGVTGLTQLTMDCHGTIFEAHSDLF